jgi:hypothetical protein
VDPRTSAKLVLSFVPAFPSYVDFVFALVLSNYRFGNSAILPILLFSIPTQPVKMIGFSAP